MQEPGLKIPHIKSTYKSEIETLEGLLRRNNLRTFTLSENSRSTRVVVKKLDLPCIKEVSNSRSLVGDDVLETSSPSLELDSCFK